MLALLPLLGKRIDDLSLTDLQNVAQALKIKVDVTDELRDAGLALLKGANIDKVADLIQSPESVQQLLAIFQPKQDVVEPFKKVTRCPFCESFFFA